MFSDAKTHGERDPSRDAMVITWDPWDDAPIPMAVSIFKADLHMTI